MNIQQLETFYWIAQLGTFSAAADRLCTSQAAVSARIRELESELELTLFDRIGRQVQLTLKGRELLVHATKVIVDAAQLRLAAGRPEMVQGVLKMGVGEVVAWRSLVALYNAVKQRYPGLGVEFQVDLNTNLLRMLSRGEIDVAVIGGPVEAADIQCRPIGAMEVAWVGTPALLTGRKAHPKDLGSLPIISLGQGARLHRQMHSWFAQGGVVPEAVSYCNSVTTMLQAVRAGIFICMAPKDLVAQDIEAGTLTALPGEPALPPLTFFVATRLESVDPALDDIARMVADVTRLPAA
jgi:DNA-binding transcriptional LysR family regulator